MEINEQNFIKEEANSTPNESSKSDVRSTMKSFLSSPKKLVSVIGVFFLFPLVLFISYYPAKHIIEKTNISTNKNENNIQLFEPGEAKNNPVNDKFYLDDIPDLPKKFEWEALNDVNITGINKVYYSNLKLSEETRSGEIMLDGIAYETESVYNTNQEVTGVIKSLTSYYQKEFSKRNWTYKFALDEEYEVSAISADSPIGGIHGNLKYEDGKFRVINIFHEKGGKLKEGNTGIELECPCSFKAQVFISNITPSTDLFDTISSL